MKFRLSLLMAGLVLANAATAATEVNLHSQPLSYLKKQLSSQDGKVKFQVVRTDVDFNNTAHTRIQQMYDGIPVWDATAIIHTPNSGNVSKHSLAPVLNNTTMNGVIYENLEKDLANSSTKTAFAFSKPQQETAMAVAKNTFAKNQRLSASSFKDEKSQIIVFVDEDKKAHYAYLNSFSYSTPTEAHRPVTIVDAATHKIYRTWEGLLFANTKDAAIAEARAQFSRMLNNKNNNNNDDDNNNQQDPNSPVYNINAGGIGGNIKMGEVVYDGAQGNKSAFNLKAMDMEYEIFPGSPYKYTLCALMNDDIMVIDMSVENIVINTCSPNPKAHNGVAWLSNDRGQTRWYADEMNDGYSPSLDAFFAATTIKNFYQDWYNVPALIDNETGEPMQFIMRVHYGRKYDNAFWDGEQMTFGDGGSMFYPMTSVGVTAHEISHGFTDTHSHIDYANPQMGALHESFSDMAAVTVENYMNGTNGWDIGREVMKNEGALRYLNTPTKDGSSIDHMKDFDATEAHGAAGITNKAFYLMATSKGWTTRKAFDVWMKANMHYWNSSMTTFAEAACGVVSATKDYGYNVADVRIAFAKVGIDTDTCESSN